MSPSDFLAGLALGILAVAIQERRNRKAEARHLKQIAALLKRVARVVPAEDRNHRASKGVSIDHIDFATYRRILELVGADATITVHKGRAVGPSEIVNEPLLVFDEITDWPAEIQAGADGTGDQDERAQMRAQVLADANAPPEPHD